MDVFERVDDAAAILDAARLPSAGSGPEHVKGNSPKPGYPEMHRW